MKKPTRAYTNGEEISHAITHFVGSHLSAAATALIYGGDNVVHGYSSS